MNISELKINFLGDSITLGCGTSDFKYRFSDRIQRKYGCVCRNYGIGGTRIATQKKPSEIAEYDLSFCPRVKDMDPDADVVLVFGGTNDYGHGDAPLGKMSDRTDDTFYGALHMLYSSLVNKYPAAKIAVITPLHRLDDENPRGDGSKPEDVGTLHDYVAIIRQVAEYYAFPVLDLYATSGLQPNIPIIMQKYMPEGLHPNDDGHVILAEKVEAFLKSL